MYEYLNELLRYIYTQVEKYKFVIQLHAKVSTMQLVVVGGKKLYPSEIV